MSAAVSGWLYVVRKAETLSAEQISEHCALGLTAYKMPKEIVFADELPKSLIGKILRKSSNNRS